MHVKMQMLLPSHSERRIMAAAVAASPDPPSKTSGDGLHHLNDSASAGHPTSEHTEHLCTADLIGEPTEQPSTSQSAGSHPEANVVSLPSQVLSVSESSRLTVQGSEPGTKIERTSTYMSPLLLAVATQDALEPEQRQHEELASQHSITVPAGFRMASEEQEHDPEQPNDALAIPQIAPSSAASVDFEDGAQSSVCRSSCIA